MRKLKQSIIIFLATVFISGIFIANFFRGKYVMPIIMYHSVVPSPDPKNRLAVSAASFKRQMRFLKEHRYNVLPLEMLATLIKEKKKIPPKTIAITFDDGYQDNYAYAFPVLKEYNLPATLFIIVNEVGRAGGSRLSWEEIKVMQDSGLISVGSHCLGPEPLINIKPEEALRKEIFTSKKILEEKLGTKVNIFSYPGGFFNAKIRQLVADAGYRAAVATNPGKRSSSGDIFALKRLRISSNCDNLFVFWVETSGYYNFFRENKRK